MHCTDTHEYETTLWKNINNIIRDKKKKEGVNYDVSHKQKLVF